MSRRENDPIGHVPKMTPAHDEIASFKRTKTRGTLASLGDVPDIEGGTASTGVKSVLTMVIIVLLATAGWAAYLYQQLQKTQAVLNRNEVRISELERKLLVTDESMNESSLAIKVKVKDMDKEIRKLWDNVWKRNKERFAIHDSKLKALEQGVQRSDNFMATATKQLSQNNTVVSELSTKLKDVATMEATVLANQQKLTQQESHLESASDKVNRVNSEINKIDRRVKSTEEWVESINGFRRQVNRDISGLKQSVGRLEDGKVTP